jgi:hypothetical protein
LTSGESFKVNYKVSSNCSEGLKQVELWRKDETSDWLQINTNTLDGETGPLFGSFTDSPPAPGKYWYGVHVVDNAGNWNDEKNSNTNGQPSSFEPVKVEIKNSQESIQPLVLNPSTPRVLYVLKHRDNVSINSFQP